MAWEKEGCDHHDDDDQEEHAATEQAASSIISSLTNLMVFSLSIQESSQEMIFKSYSLR